MSIINELSMLHSPNPISSSTPQIPFRLIRAFFLEASLFFTNDSVFLDSPLNQEGREQAIALRKVFEKIRDRYVNFLLLSSPLRRAVSTVLLGLGGGGARDDLQKVRLIDCLQEISRNVDTQALACSKGEKPEPDFGVKKGAKASNDEKDCHLKLSKTSTVVRDETKTHAQLCNDYAFRLDPSLYRGGKRICGKRGIDRVNAFPKFVFNDDVPEGNTGPATAANIKIGQAGSKVSAIVIAGHSLWFRNFFDVFLPIEPGAPTPGSLTQLARTKKMKNGGVIGFRLQKLERGGPPGRKKSYYYKIDGKSIEEIHLGFER